ncbi:hypothetical protein ACH4NF_08845 [Streptomyces sp. NPDC017248]|uniref:hypothetical protein n=1 Tax=unclassified Streptomyces TaxID=2593676 RepID=UPI0037A16175
MHHHDPFAARICPHCDGFATVAVDSGTRDRHGRRLTFLIDCSACGGSGVYPRMPRHRFSVQAGR